ncbi:MAG TPA: V-type ATP synthase subunit D [Planctomycetota bacterium]|nr:V-type ATP synthase subunit D [Planctomycetota bacterium]
MAKLNIPPTRSNLLTVQRNLTFAFEGFELLEQKRQILVLELMTRLERARAVQKDVDARMADAHEAMRDALAAAGTADMRRESLGISATHEIGVSEQRVMGINLPTVTVSVKPVEAEFAPGSGAVQSDTVMKLFRDALEAIGRLAEVENAVVRLSHELKRTQRRVNALEKIFLPNYRETVKYITDVLDERERDSFVIMKTTKKRLHTRGESDGQ